MPNTNYVRVEMKDAFKMNRDRSSISPYKLQEDDDNGYWDEEDLEEDDEDWDEEEWEDEEWDDEEDWEEDWDDAEEGAPEWEGDEWDE